MRAHRLPCLVVALLVASGLAHASDAVTHLSTSTVAETGRTRVIAFRAAPAPDRRRFDAAVSDERVLTIVRGAAVLADEGIGYVRVRGERPGTCVLTVGGAPLEVRVVEPRGPGADDAPRIIGPADGAAVWGRIAVGIETRATDVKRTTVALRLPDGAMLEPVSDTGARTPPWRQLRFDLDTTDLPPGPLDVVPVASGPDGAREGTPVRLDVRHPAAADLSAGEAEAPYDLERPERFADARVNTGRDRDASGGAYFVNASAQPAVCFPLEVEEPGTYQVLLVARGTRAQGALPTVGIVVDDEPQSTTNVRVLDTTWHRIAAGIPFALEPGTHVITPFFANDFFVPRLADRNLHLDRIEIARVGGPGADAAAPMMMMAMGGGMAAGADADDPMGARPVGLRIAFVRPLDGTVIPGLFEIGGRAWWDGVEQTPAPHVTLLVNDVPVATQRSGAPRFWVDPSHFDAGPNRVTLVAQLADGTTARTPEQTLRWLDDEPPAGRGPTRRHHRFTMHDERWDDAARARLSTHHRPKERRAAAFAGEGTASLALPASVAGHYEVFLELRGDSFEGPAVATVALRSGDDETEVGAIEAPTWWNLRQVGPVEIAAGDDNRLDVSFLNDHYVRERGDRNLYVEAVILVERPKVDDRVAPNVVITYPPDDHAAFGVDALVAEASDNASLASAELIVDDMPTGLSAGLNLKPGRFVFPLLLRGLEPGPHTFAVRVTDVAGNSTISETVAVEVLDRDRRGPYARAIRLLDRFAFGPDPHELAAILTMGERAWLADRLDRAHDDAGDLAALGAGFPYFAGRSQYEVPARAVAHALLTPNPVRARFVLWAENHFSTWIRKVQGDRKWEEHVTFTRLGAAPFDRLLLASAQSPAMLGYLDQEASYVGRLNENFAREIMELHTLGVHGGYTQQDVTNLARLLTGWTASFEGDGRGGGQEARTYTFRFDPALNDGSATRMLGMAFPEARRSARYDRVHLALETLAAHPSTAAFVSRTLAEHYVAAPAPDDLVDDLAVVFHETGGDLRAMLMTIAAHPTLMAADERIAAPFDYATRMFRATRHFHPWRLRDFLQRSGVGLFDCPTPDGYPDEDPAFADSNAMLQRWRLAQDVRWPLTELVPGAWRWRADLPDDVWADTVIDVVAARLTGRLLTPESHAAARELIASTEGNRDRRVQVVAPFIAALPEANLR
jgi:hypothetical protein